MNNKHIPLPLFHKLLVVLVALALATLACNLTSDPPATLAPRAPQSTLTPEGPIGPQASIQAPPATDQPLPNNVSSNLPNNPSVAAQLQQLDTNRMMNDIRTLVTFQTRHTFSESAPDRGIHAARNWLFQQFEAIKAANPQTRIDIYPQQFSYQFAGESRSGQNIMMVMNGTVPEAGALVIGAHYDTVSNIITQADNFQPGANDNGTGVAAVLEIARIMAQTPRRATIVFVLFDAEELGRYGSKAFARDFIQAQRIPLRAMINLDIIGNPVGVDGSRYDNQMRAYSAEPNSSGSRQLARLVELVARVYMPDMRVNVRDTVDRADRWGDHQEFSNLGYPAVRLIEQEDDFRFAHNERDTIDNIDPNYLRRTTQVALATLLVLADGPTAPTMRQINSEAWRLEWAPVQNAVSYVIALRRPGSLKYDVEMTIQGGTSMTWASFPNFEAVAVAAVDANGQLGPFSREQIIQTQPPTVFED